MATITDRLQALNETDLSRLLARIQALRAEAEKTLKIKTATEADLAAAARSAGMSPEEFLALLEWAKKVT